MKLFGLIGMIAFQLIFSQALRASDEAPKASLRSTQADPKPTSCKRYLRFFTGGLLALAIGGGLATVLAPVYSEYQLKRTLEQLRDVDAAVATDAQKAAYARVLFRDFLSDQSTLMALWDVLLLETYYEPELATKATELGIPLTNSQEFYDFLGIHPEDLVPQSNDSVGVKFSSDRWVKVDVDADFGDWKRARRRMVSGPAVEKLETFFKEWLDRQSYGRLLRYSFSRAKEDRESYLMGKQVLANTPAGVTGISALPRSMAELGSLGTLIRLELPPTSREDTKILAWLKNHSYPQAQDYDDHYILVGRRLIRLKPGYYDSSFMYAAKDLLKKDPSLPLETALERVRQELEATPPLPFEEMPRAYKIDFHRYDFQR